MKYDLNGKGCGGYKKFTSVSSKASKDECEWANFMSLRI